MKIGDIEIVPTFSIDRTTYCPKCRNYLREVSNGWFNKVLYCPKEDIFFEIKLVKMQEKRINKKYWNEIKEKFNSIKGEIV